MMAAWNRDPRHRNRILMAVLWLAALALFLFVFITKYLASTRLPS